jgi:dCTP deaminase
LDTSENLDYKEITDKFYNDEGMVLNPHETCLGITKEKITLSSKLCGLLEGRSRFARLGKIKNS